MTQGTASSETTDRRPPVDRADFIIHLLFFTLLWMLLTEGVLVSWIIGILVVPWATWAVVSLQRPATAMHNPSINIPGFIRFLPFFFWHSLRGGWECAMLAILPQRRLRLGFLRYTTRLPVGRSRLWFLRVISLLPGTLSAAVDGNDIIIHVLDTDDNHQQSLEICEQKLAMLFAIQLGKVDEKQEMQNGFRPEI